MTVNRHFSGPSRVLFLLHKPPASIVLSQHFQYITPRAERVTSARQLFHNRYIGPVSREKTKIHTERSDKLLKGGGGRRYASSAELCGEDRTSDGRPANCGRTPPRPSPPYAPSTHRGPDGGQYSPRALLNVNYLAFIILAVALLRFASKVKCVTIKIDYCYYYYYCLMVISNLYLIILTLQPEPQR